MPGSCMVQMGMFLMVAAFSAFGEDSSSTAPAGQSVTTAPIAADSGSVQASVEVRPSVSVEEVGEAKQKMAKYTTENTVDLGYQFNSKVYAGYRQSFETNVYTSVETANGLNPTISDSVLRAKIKDIYSSGDFSVSYEPRLYLPLSSSMQDKGNVAVIRNYIVATQKLGSSVTVSLMEIPIFHVNNQAGSIANGKSTANSAIENRVYLLASVSLTDKLSLDIPLMVNSVRSAKFDGAENNGRLTHTLWTYPEIDYAITSNFAVGAAYYSGNMLDYQGGDLMGLDLSKGLESGTAQLVLRANL